MKYIFTRLNNFEKASALSLKAGLVVVIFFCALLLSYIYKAESIADLLLYKDCIPSLVLSVIIVFGGAFAFDVLLKENKQ